MRSAAVAIAAAIAVWNAFSLIQAPEAAHVSRSACDDALKQWAEQEIRNIEALSREQSKLQLQDLLFFLHIPRTGGRNYNQCFLKNLFASEQLCPRSYDKLRVDPSKPSCSLLSTHDDYSIVTKLPKTATSVVTNMRDPVGRVLSSYEFSVEVASRFLRRPPKVLMKRMEAINKKNGMKSMSTLDIWPWKYLVPMMQRDLFDRRDSRVSGITLDAEDYMTVYDVPAYVMPLKDFVDHPAVHDLVHNGATFQVAGVTNNSYLEEASYIRNCVSRYQELGDHILKVAKRRLESMLYVGLTERHKESAEVFVHLVGRQAVKRKSLYESNETSAAAPLDRHEAASLNDTSYEDFIDQMVMSYQKCSNHLRSTQVTRRITSLMTIAPVNFSKEARRSIPGDVLSRISELNKLDIRLHEHARKLFTAERDFLRQHIAQLKKVDTVEYMMTTAMEKSEGEWEATQSLNLLAGAIITATFATSLYCCFASSRRWSCRGPSHARKF